jgi:hypothetical protein
VIGPGREQAVTREPEKPEEEETTKDAEVPEDQREAATGEDDPAFKSETFPLER